MSTENTEQNESIEQTGNKKLTKNGKIVLGVILSLVLIVSIVLISFVLVPVVRNQRSKRAYDSLSYVDIKVVNPNTGEYLEDGDTVVVGDERIKAEVEFYDPKTGERITELPGYRFEDCYTLEFLSRDVGATTTSIYDYWPSKEDLGYHPPTSFGLVVRFNDLPVLTNREPHQADRERLYKSTFFGIGIYCIDEETDLNK